MSLNLVGGKPDGVANEGLWDLMGQGVRTVEELQSVCVVEGSGLFRHRG